MSELSRPDFLATVVEQLRAVWEAQPSLSLAQVWSQLEGLGVNVASTDVEVQDALGQLAGLHPGSVAASGWAQGSVTVLVTLRSPERAVTLTPDGMLISRSPQSQTVAWPVGRVVSSRAGTEFVVEDESGVLHRLGVVERLSVLERRWELFDAHSHSPSGPFPLPRSAVGDAVFVARCADGTVVTIGHAIRVDSATRRDLHREFLRGWERVEACAVGSPLLVKVAGGEVRRVGDEVVDAVWRVE